MAYDKKALHKGSHVADDDETFLAPSKASNPFSSGEASGHGYNAKWSDSDGHERGAQSQGADDASFLRPSWEGDYSDAPHTRLSQLIDNQEDFGSGNKLTGGGGPVSRNLPEGDSSPRYAPKSGSPSKQTNMRKPR